MQKTSWIRLIAFVGALAAAAAVVTSTPVTAEAQRRSAAAQQQASSADGVVNLNTATSAELQRLPGVGQSKADAIVSMRERRGPFQRVEQIMLVRGIGRATFRRLRPMLTIEGATTLGATSN